FDLDGSMKLFRSHLSRTNYPLTLVVDPAADLQFQVIFDASRFAGDAVERMLGHLATILETMATNVEQPVAGVNLLTPVETRTLLLDWNGAQSSVVDQPVSRLFEQQVERTPHAVAAIQENRQLTYAELNARANKLAHYLKTLGVGSESLVGVCVERSIEMLVAVLATLKAGGAYLPLDPTYPQDRLQFMLSDSDVKVLLTKDHLLQALPEYHGP